MNAPSENKLIHCVIYLFAVFQDLDLVLTASGLVVKVRCPFAFGAHVLVVVQFAQLLTRFFWTDHGYHGLMMLRWRTHLKKRRSLELVICCFRSQEICRLIFCINVKNLLCIFEVINSSRKMNSPPQRYEPMVAMICLEKNE